MLVGESGDVWLAVLALLDHVQAVDVQAAVDEVVRRKRRTLGRIVIMN